MLLCADHKANVQIIGIVFISPYNALAPTFIILCL